MILEIKYRYRNLDYLVSDKCGNLYLLPHFNEKRSVLLTKVSVFENKNKTGEHKTIKYKGSNYSFTALRKLKIEVDEKFEYFVSR